MKLDALISCEVCHRVVRNSQSVMLQIGGVTVFSAPCCRACASDIEITVARLVRETRASAVMGQPR